jgi:ribosome-associated translation inhibitor RaiA
MQVQINTDHSVKVHDSESAQLLRIVEGAVSRFEKDITRVEMHLSDENAAGGSPDDKRCLLEARIKGRKPLAVSHLADSVILAVEGAAEKLARSIESDVGRRAAIHKHQAGPLLDESEIENE